MRLDELTHSFLDLALRDFVQGTGGLVKKQNLGLTNDCSSDGNTLLLTSREARALGTTHDFVALMELVWSTLFSGSVVNCFLLFGFHLSGGLSSRSGGSHNIRHDLDQLVILLLAELLDHLGLVEI